MELMNKSRFFIFYFFIFAMKVK